MIFVLGIIFGIGYCNFVSDNCEDTPVITFLHNDSFSGMMPIAPGYNVIINVQSDTSVGFVRDNCWTFYTVTEDGFTHYESSGECQE